MPLRFFMVLVASCAAAVFLTWPTERAPSRARPVTRGASPAPRVAAPEPVVSVEDDDAPAPTAAVSVVGGASAVGPGRVRLGPAVAPGQGGVVGGHSGDLSPAPSTAARVKADATGRLPTSGQVRTDVLGNREVRLDNGVTATTSRDALGGSTTRFSNGVTASSRTDALGGTTTRYSNGVTANSRKDALGNTDTVYSDGTRSTTRVDPFGNQVTTYSDGRTETIRPDPFAPRTQEGKNDRK
jgi:hypothetical protein